MSLTEININDYGLVLEGGGMRGIFTCGVLDYFIDNNIDFPYVVGVSAGACNGLSYISKQRGRARYSNIEMLEKYHYIGIKHFLKNRNIMDFNLLFKELPESIYPYDYGTYFSSPTRYEMVTTNCLTGKAEYFEEKKNIQRLLDIARASSSLPIMCPIAYVDNVPMLDGGICDSIPVQRAIDKGHKNNIVVLTRNKGYRKEKKDIKVPRFVYRKYPALRDALSNRNRVYNEQLDLVDKLEEEGKIIVIRPLKPVEVDRIEKDTKKLEALYEEGYQCAKNIFESIKVKKE
ncbi:MAG: patatin family protein [Dysgonomonas sp.]